MCVCVQQHVHSQARWASYWAFYRRGNDPCDYYKHQCFRMRGLVLVCESACVCTTIDLLTSDLSSVPLKKKTGAMLNIYATGTHEWTHTFILLHVHIHTHTHAWLDLRVSSGQFSLCYHLTSASQWQILHLCLRTCINQSWLTSLWGSSHHFVRTLHCGVTVCFHTQIIPTVQRPNIYFMFHHVANIYDSSIQYVIEN